MKVLEFRRETTLRGAVAFGVLLASCLGGGCARQDSARFAASPQASSSKDSLPRQGALPAALPAAVSLLQGVEEPTQRLPPPVLIAADLPGPTTQIYAWKIPSCGSSAKPGDRVYVLSNGRDHRYDDPDAVYRLYAHDVVKVRGDYVSLRQLGGPRFEVRGLFVIPAGLGDKVQVKRGDMVLAEWASSLRHAVVTERHGQRIGIHYLDLPASWANEQLEAVKGRREITLQREGLRPGNFAVARLQGRSYRVLLIRRSGDRWLVQRFAGRVAVVAPEHLTPIPLRPHLKRRQRVLAPWAGVMYPGRVKSIEGVRVEVRIEGIDRQAPVVTSLGQVLPLAPRRRSRAHR